MLTKPSKGFAHSVHVHNVQLDILCDWIEASVLLDDEELSTTDIVDVLIEEEVYTTEDFAREMLSNAWNELQRRQTWIGDSCAFTIDSMWIKQRKGWKEVAAHTFCILLSLAPVYDWWVKEFDSDYMEQGELFELLTKEFLEAQFSGWTVYQTGWTRSNTTRLKTVVGEVASRLGEELVHLDLWDHPKAKEAGLDLLCYREFPDKRVGIPVYLMQCASGDNWKSKLPTPNMGLWNEMITFRNSPQKAFSAPFSLPDRELKQACVLARGPGLLGLFLDRCRLLRGYEDWISSALNERIVTWAEPRVEVLLKRST